MSAKWSTPPKQRFAAPLRVCSMISIAKIILESKFSILNSVSQNIISNSHISFVSNCFSDDHCSQVCCSPGGPPMQANANMVLETSLTGPPANKLLTKFVIFAITAK